MTGSRSHFDYRKFWRPGGPIGITSKSWKSYLPTEEICYSYSCCREVPSSISEAILPISLNIHRNDGSAVLPRFVGDGCILAHSLCVLIKGDGKHVILRVVPAISTNLVIFFVTIYGILSYFSTIIIS